MTPDDRPSEFRRLAWGCAGLVCAGALGLHASSAAAASLAAIDAAATGDDPERVVEAGTKTVKGEGFVGKGTLESASTEIDDAPPDRGWDYFGDGFRGDPLPSPVGAPVTVPPPGEPPPRPRVCFDPDTGDLVPCP